MSNIKLYSFDIFDTLITRKVATPDGIFILMQELLNKDARFLDIPQEIKENFYIYRKDAAWHQRRLKKTLKNFEEISFDSIYERIKQTFYLSENQVELLKQLELEIELDSVLPIIDNINKVKTLLRQNKRVILISDMYLPKYIIKEMLRKIDPEIANIKLYLSSEIKKMKETGEAYIYVKNKEGIPYEKWQHTGDHEKNDYLIAKQLGIEAKHYKYISLEKYEKKALKTLGRNSIVQLSIGCSKNLRLNNFSKNIKAQLGASLTAPILYPYIFWVIQQAIKRNMKHLFFIARDCYIPLQMAQEIIKILDLDISVSYFYGSRKAWFNAGIDINNELLKQNIISYYTSANCSELENRCELTEEELRSILPNKFQSYKKGFSPELKEEFIKYLLNNDTLLNYIKDKYKNKRLQAKNYFEQNISKLKGNNFAFVEIDGSGLTNSCFASIIETIGQIESFYFFRTSRIYDSNQVKYNYFSSIRKKGGSYIAEMLVRAPHGQTLGYKLKDNIWEPELENIDTSVFQEWQYDKYLDGIIEYTKQLTCYYKKNKKYLPTNQILINSYIDYLVNSVDKETVRLLIKMSNRFQKNVINDEFAPEITFLQAIKYLLGYDLKTDNITYSLLRSKGCIRKIIELKNKCINSLNI